MLQWIFKLIVNLARERLRSVSHDDLKMLATIINSKVDSKLLSEEEEYNIIFSSLDGILLAANILVNKIKI